MALTSTVYVFDISLSDVDRGVYETFSLKVAQHPSETDSYMVTRVLAYALEYTEGIRFTQGLSAAEEPALWVRDLTGRLLAWIEVGTPDAARLHKASKSCDRVVVYCHKDPTLYERALAGQKVHAAERIRYVVLDRRLISELAEKLERRNVLSVSLNAGELYVDLGETHVSTTLDVRPLPVASR